MLARAPRIGLRPALIAATAMLFAVIPGIHAQGRPVEVGALWAAAKHGAFTTLLVQVATRERRTARPDAVVSATMQADPEPGRAAFMK